MLSRKPLDASALGTKLAVDTSKEHRHCWLQIKFALHSQYAKQDSLSEVESVMGLAIPGHILSLSQMECVCILFSYLLSTKGLAGCGYDWITQFVMLI